MKNALAGYLDWGRSLWLDYYCIDQDKKEKKDPQIAAMGSIFANSSQTNKRRLQMLISRRSSILIWGACCALMKQAMTKNHQGKMRSM